MAVDLSHYRNSPAVGLRRYRVASLTVVKVEEGYLMSVPSGLMVAGLVMLAGILKIEKVGL